jgi:hypothetical protein
VRNITVALDDDLARWTRVEAAKADLSVSRFIAELLRDRRVRSAEYQLAMTTYLSQPSTQLREPGERLPTRDELHIR